MRLLTLFIGCVFSASVQANHTEPVDTTVA